MKPPVTALDKPSILGKSNLFSSINVVIVDGDHKLAILVKKILYGLGFNRIYIVHDGSEALDLMKEEQIDIVVTDWEGKTMSGLDLTVYLRQSMDSPNRMIPILMLTGRNSRKEIEAARNAGVTEYLTKPFSAKSLLERIHTIVESPRNFILCKTFVGPDRRRISSLTLPADPEEKHTIIERRPPVIVPRDQLQQLILDDTPRMILPDYTLKKKIGFAVPTQFITSSEVVEQSEGAINDAYGEFLQWMMKDVDMLQQAYQLLVANPDHVNRLITNIKEAAYSIKARAGTFGYKRASEVADLLYNFCQKSYDKENKYHLIILEKHIQTISVIFTGNIRGEGGALGEELVKDLGKLIAKYIDRKD